MRNFLFLLILLSSCSYPPKEKSIENKLSLTDQQIIKKYLENGAWTVRYFSPEYQIYIDSAIALNPRMAYLYQQKSMPYFKKRKYELGLISLNKAVELDPKSHLDYSAFVKCIFVKTYKESITDFLKVKELKGEAGFVMDHSYDFYIGLCYLQLEDYASSLRYLQKSIEQTRNTKGEDWIHFLDLFYAGVAYQEMERHTEAIQYFNHALKSYPDFSDAAYYKALSLFRIGQTDEAENILNECELNFKKGYTINEANAVYEDYPYQIKQYYIDLLRATKR